MFARASLLAVLVVCAACDDTTGPTIPQPSDAGATADANSDAGGGGGLPGGQCLGNDECTAYENTCGTCSCLALASNASPPACTDKVSCFAPSCTGLVATCTNGTCQLGAK